MPLSRPAFLPAAVGAALLLAAAETFAAVQSKFNLAPPATPIARDVHWLHWMMLVICGVIFVAVFGVMFYSIWKHRKSKGAVAATFHESTKVEIVWTVIPFLIVIGMALPATKAVVAMKDTSNSDLTIKVTGYQWKWGYDYLKGEGEGISFLSKLSTPREQIENQAPKSPNYLLEVDNPLVVPVDKKVRILTTADDVIHSWTIPAFAVKQDAIPGFIRDTWFRADKIGTYHGSCVELCGKDHAFMPIVVQVVSAEDYSKWVAAQKAKMAAAADDPTKVWELAELKQRGERVYAANCAACHQASGAGVPNAFPGLVQSKVVLGPAAEQIQLVLHGRKGVFAPTSVMPGMGTLSDVDIAAAITYTRHAWGNNAAEGLVQPAQVKAARAAK
ncbi:MAG: cytochrome c oxidase subunit II [Burkholderiales bacterium]|jgi:cytochrome c oxidase subunit 2|nr:cytochrome c oxidase subunit II [Burkholderiales bacterium]